MLAYRQAAAAPPYLIEAEHMLEVSEPSLLVCWMSSAVGTSTVLGLGYAIALSETESVFTSA